MRVKITKIGILPHGEHSVFAAIRDDFIGRAEGYPKLGERYNVYGNVSLEISTSPVTKEIDEEGIFETTYSRYQLIVLNKLD